MSYADREWVLPTDFPDPPAAVGFNRQWVPVATTVFQGWYCLPLELSAKQLAELEARINAQEAEAEAETTVIPADVRKYSLIQHLLLDARIDGLEPSMWQDPTGLNLPSVELARAIYSEGVQLVARARTLGNSLRPFSGTTNPEAAANSRAGNKEAA